MLFLACIKNLFFSFGESLMPALSTSSYVQSCFGTPNYIIQLGRQLSNNPGYGEYFFGPPGFYRNNQNTTRIGKLI